MTLVGCDLHSRKQQVAVLDTTTGEVLEQELTHDGDVVERFYRALRPPVTIGIVTTGYTQWLHGEAVAAGMVVAADMSARMGMLPTTEVQRVRDLLARIGLPVEPPRFGAQRALEYMSVDKKVKSGRIRLVLLERLGAACFTADYADEALHSTLAAHFG